ncbi:MAG: HAMP domain-containing histidine kinase [Ruminococcus sp.]|nr:HAMP domain-containing histidine kinase [Ruminococcus sp.]
MSDKLHPVTRKYSVFVFVRMLVLQLLAMSLIAVSVGLIAINQYREDFHARIEASCTMVAEGIVNYGNKAVQEDSISSAEVMKDDSIQFMLDLEGEQTDINLFLFDAQGQGLACSGRSGVSSEEVQLTASMMYIVDTQGTYTSEVSGKFNQNDRKPVLCRGTSFRITEPDGTETKYFLFSNTHPDEIEAFIRKVLIVSFIAVGAMLLAYAAFIYRYVAKNRVQPDELLARVTRMYAQGDFSEKLEPEKFDSPRYQEIVRSLNQIVSNLKATGEQQAQFVSNVSHELRTPMTIISGYVDGILDGTVPKNKRTEYLYIVSQEMQRLKILVSSMLNLTKFDNGTIQIKHELFPINDLIFRTMLMFGNRLEKRNITVEGLDSDTVRVYGDRDLIGQVIYNLTENAVKFVDTGGTITIRLEETKEASIFAIRNTGPGIPKDELPKIFGRFYKSDFSRSQDKTGLGLGLDIIRKILKLHDAQIGVSSEENVFTEFVVSFPKKPQAENDES